MAKKIPEATRLDPTAWGTDAERLLKEYGRLIIGQEEPVRKVVDAYQTWKIGLSQRNKPVCSFLFLGPTGVGKTRVVEVLGELVFGVEGALTKVDCAEYAHSHEIAKLLGSPPGYLGHRETQAYLCQANIDRYQTPTNRLNLVLFDEIEKASDALWNLLLGILDKAILTLGDGQVVDFSKSMIFMTSNLGSGVIGRQYDKGIGFVNEVPVVDAAFCEKATKEATQKKFTPEFINRIDKVVTFQPLGRTELQRIMEIELGLMMGRMNAVKVFQLQMTEHAKEWLLGKGTDLRYGARPVKRAIEEWLVKPLSRLLATGQIQEGSLITADIQGDGLYFVREAARGARPAPEVPVSVGA